MAPQMSKTAAVAAVAGTAFVALPSRQTSTPTSTPGSARSALRGAAASNGTSAMMSTVGVVLGATAVAALRKDTKNGKRATATQLSAFENELGVQAPLGFWDPAGLSSDGDAREFYRRRVVEIKHGRVSMLACTGALADEEKHHMMCCMEHDG